MIRLRAAEPADEPFFYHLRKEIIPDLTQEDHGRWWETHEYRYVALDGNLTVGVIRIAEERMGTGLVSLQVLKTFQGKGYGTEMLETIRETARVLGFVRLSAVVDVENGASQAAFTWAGWRPTAFQVSV